MAAVKHAQGWAEDRTLLAKLELSGNTSSCLRAGGARETDVHSLALVPARAAAEPTAGVDVQHASHPPPRHVQP